jgi:hypothetical protein
MVGVAEKTDSKMFMMFLSTGHFRVASLAVGSALSTPLWGRSGGYYSAVPGARSRAQAQTRSPFILLLHSKSMSMRKKKEHSYHPKDSRGTSSSH